ncbi:lysosome-associated membrane glycoprotein 2 isoform X3 [Sceloporus undulatus]|uniref:lysosome-associated membrane glycoprotein 2 isoform X3 n=1 Tax=Sceloporus undulatus TaxID=8520 RepID=UPI001C4BB2AB|nr:lysosome-associated membrane glycoprotein 2 isoform X3 [Sceloporus undulatus]
MAPRLLRVSLRCGFALFVLVLFQTNALDVEVKDDDNVTCLFAQWKMNISIKYETEGNEYKNVAFMLPTEVRYDGSTCGNETYGPILALEFEEGHSWVISFTKTSNTYQGIISFTYNTNDTKLFPDAKRKGPITIAVKYPVQPVKLYTVFSCHDMESVESDNITQEIWNVTLQTFLEDGSLSSKKTICDIDTMPTTTTTTTTTSTTTTTQVTTNTTTVPTTTTVTFPPLPTLQPIERPATGSYSLTNNTVVCLLATMALQLNISQKVPLVINYNPNTTVASGSCGSSVSVLTLTDGSCRVEFVFAVKNTSAETFFLREVNITIIESRNATLSAANRSLNYWEASLGSSYMCQKEETLIVTPGYKMNIFDLKIQPFDVKDNQYAAAEECKSSDLLFIIPIVVGVLVGLLLIVGFVFYMIGRRKKSSGYQAV